MMKGTSFVENHLNKKRGEKMKGRIFFERNLNFGKRLVRLHHYNAILFFLLSLTGLLLFSSSFRSTFPAVRVWVNDAHVWLGIVSCLPVLFYLTKMKKHLKTLQKKRNHRINLYFILLILLSLIVSGMVLTFHRQFPPYISTWSLMIHDLATWLGLPYVIYHSVTRSRWFKNLEKRTKRKEIVEEPMVIEDDNPVYSRRTFLRVLSGGVITIVFSPVIVRWLKTTFPSTPLSVPEDSGRFDPLPKPNAQSAPPVGGGREGQFRYYTVTEMPNLNDENWSFTIDGLVDRPTTYTWDQFIQLKRNVQVSDFHCVTGWSVYNITWEGIPLKTLLKQAGVGPKAKYVKFYSADGVYTDTLTLKQANQDDVMVSVLIDGELISKKNGGPVRLITPRMYAYKSVKWLNRIELIENEHIGYWEKRGYPQDAWLDQT